MVKNQPQKTCIIILGMHRSGTSALTRLVNICGASLPNTLLNATKGNKTGHWESQKIVDMHDQFLSKVGSSWNDCSKLDLEAISTSIQTDYIDDLASLLNSEYNDSSLIVLKDPRICRFLPLTLKAITAANFIPKIIHIIRNPIEVSKSLTTRDGLTEETGHLLWLRHNIDAEKHSRNMAYTSLTYDNLLKNWKECLDNIQTSLKLFNRDSLSSIAPQINEFLSPRHRHHTHTLEDTLIDPSLKSWLGLTFETFVNAQRGYLSEKSQSHLDTVNMEFSAATPFIIKMLAKTQAQSKLIETNETVIAQLNNEISRERDTIKSYKKLEAETLKGLAWERSQHEQTQHALKAYEKREAENLKGLAWERSQHEQTQHALKAYEKREAETLKGLAWERSQHEQTQQALKAYEKREAETLKELAWERSQHEQTLQTFHKRETEILKARSSERKQHEHTQQSFEKSLNTLSMKFDKQVAETEFKTSQIEAMYASNSWKLGAPLRALKRAWSNKTRLLVALLAGGSARALLQNSNDLQLAAEQSRSSAILNSRIALQKNRQNTPDASWLKSYLNRGILVQDKDLPNVTISVVLYNSEQWLWNFFMSVEALHYPMAKIAIHFIDNGSSDKTIEAVNTFIEKNKHRYNKLKITERPNLGYGMGNDFAIRDAETDFVLVTNVDIEFYPDCLRNLVAVAISDDEKVACWETRQTPYEHPKYYDPVTLESNWSAHAAVLLRRSAYLDVGGYDPNIFMYGEDVELSYRFRAKGWKLRYVPIATIYHHVELDNSDVRPHQLSGSSAANILLRYRYGTYRDILAGEAFFYAVKRNETNPLRAEAWEKVEKILRKNRWYFFKSRIRTNGKIHFPFNEFDYDITRPGEAVIREPFKPSEAKNLPLVSIITRTHGPADIHLRNVISNVLTQTYPNIEHIIVEDKTDFAKDYVAKMSDTYGDRIKYLKSPGQGRSECGNHGAKHAKGQYLCWLDNDDLLFADHIETLIRGLDDDASAVCSYALAWDAFVNEADGEPYAEKFELPLSHKQDYDQARFNTENFIPIQAIVFRKSLFNQYGGFNADFSQLEDWNLWARYSEVGKFIYTPKVTSVYFTPSDSEKRNERHQVLHAAYDSVKKANIADMLEIRQSLSTQIAG